MWVSNHIEDQTAWVDFVKREQLTSGQEEQFATLMTMLIAWNQKFNLTTIVTPTEIIQDHFQDSLFLRKVTALSSYKGLADIGAGAGFPALPLKIVFPDLPMVLIEVNQKKIQFLEAVVQNLGMQDVHLCALDWRTFLRKSDYELDLFVSRAALNPEELLRIFKPSSPYLHAQLVYWASQHWQPTPAVIPYIQKEEAYAIGSKNRRLIFFSATQETS